MAETSASSPSSLECPICGEEFSNPKLLPCNHVVCRRCVLHWLRQDGHGADCSLCHRRIVSLSVSLDSDLDLLVNDLPTDFSIVAQVESRKILSSQHVCGGCGDGVPATSLCFQCSMKLCDTCAGLHNKFPVMKHHAVEKLDSLTPQRLAEISHSKCKTSAHDDRPAEVYCSTHHALICMLCATTAHRLCQDAKVIKEAGAERREEFRQEAQRLREKEATLTMQITEAKDKFSTMQTEAGRIFDDLAQRLERRRQEVAAMILAEQVHMDLPLMDEVRSALRSQVRILESLVGSAPDDVLLDMGQSLDLRLSHLREQTSLIDRSQGPTDLGFDPFLLRRLEAGIATLGRLQPVAVVTPSAPNRELLDSSADASDDGSEDGSATSSSSSSSCSSSHSPIPPEPPPPPYSSTLPQPRVRPSAPLSPTSPPPISGPPPPYSSVVPQPRSVTHCSGSSSPAVHRNAAHFSSLSSSSSAQSASVQPPHLTPGASSQNYVTRNSRAMTLASVDDWTERRHGPNSSVEPKPLGAALAAVLRTGNRVKRSSDLWPRVEGSSGQGTVTAIPSQLRQLRGEDPSGFVDVVWDSGEVLCHWMGRFGRYELELL